MRIMAPLRLAYIHYTVPAQDGFTGDRCETDIDECVNSPCENGGTCVDDINSFQCTCPDDTTGYRCETGKNNHNLRRILMTVRESCVRMMGTCEDGIDSCICADSFTGNHCETLVLSMPVFLLE